MCVKISVELELALLVIVDDSFLGKEDGRVQISLRILIKPVKVLSVSIRSPVASSTSIWVQARNYLEDKAIKEQSCLVCFV